MRPFLALLLSFQFINAPVAAELGEREEFSMANHYTHEMSQLAATDFAVTAKNELKNLKKLGVNAYLAQAKSLTSDELAVVKQLTSRAQGQPLPAFVEKNGKWEAKVADHSLSFTLADLYLQQLVIDGQTVSFKGVPVADWEKKISNVLTPTKKTSWLSFSIINEAHAEPISGAILLIIAAVVGAILAGMAWYNWHYKPKQAVAAMKDLTKKLDQQAGQCENARSDQSSYDSTFNLASSISDRSKLNSVTSTENALQLTIKEQITSGNRSNLDCYKATYEIGKKIGLDVPQVTAQQLEYLEISGGETKAVSETDTKGALFGVCAAYNRLGSCMENFMRAHVSDAEGFKDSAEQNYSRYRQRAGAQGQ